MANEIVWYSSDETGAPTLNNAAGSLDAVLYACLVAGFRLQTLTSVTVAGGVATAVLAGHGYSSDRMLDLAGAATGAINGRKLITVTGSGSFTFPAPGVADGVVGGVITAKRSPLGWVRDQNTSNVSIYKRSDATATLAGLRIDDSGAGVAAATYARVSALESWSDVNTFTGQAPTAAQASGGLYWSKGVNSAAAKDWILVGDGKTFYLFTDSPGYPVSSYGVPSGVHGFGDIASYKAGDAYGYFLSGAAGGVDNGAGGVGYVTPIGGATSNGFGVMLGRLSSGLGSAVRATAVGLRGGGRMGNSGPVYPSPVDNGGVLSAPVLMSEDNATLGYPLRGHLRGLAEPLAAMSTSQPTAQSVHRQILANVTGSDRRWLIVAYQISTQYGAIAFDITGPWA